MYLRRRGLLVSVSSGHILPSLGHVPTYNYRGFELIGVFLKKREIVAGCLPEKQGFVFFRGYIVVFADSLTIFYSSDFNRGAKRHIHRQFIDTLPVARGR